MFQTEDTIAAISTATGNAPRAIVRMSGPAAVEIAGRIFRPVKGKLADLGGFRVVDGLVCLSGGVELPGRVYMFRGPRSYTRQDVVEFHVPGASAVASMLLSALLDAGARQAEAGEFTARAFMSGRIDLSQAQAVADVIAANDDAQLRSSTAVLAGEVYRLCSDAASQAADALATIEASIDLAEEEITLAEPAELAADLAALGEKLAEIAQTAGDMPDSAQSPQVVIAGRPNVGKSSLLNALSGSDRAIISALAGTTRDVLRDTATLPCGSTVDLIDVAGFGQTTDALAGQADLAATRAVEQADMILFVVGLADAEPAEDIELFGKVRAANRSAEVLLLANKADVTKPAGLSELEKLAGTTAISTSAETGAGLDEVRSQLTARLHLATIRGGQAICLHQRQRRCLLAAGQATKNAGEMLASVYHIADVAELAAIELRDCLANLGAISGQIVTDDILGRIFARFCVGK